MLHKGRLICQILSAGIPSRMQGIREHRQEHTDFRAETMVGFAEISRGAAGPLRDQECRDRASPRSETSGISSPTAHDCSVDRSVRVLSPVEVRGHQRVDGLSVRPSGHLPKCTRRSD